MRSRRASRCRKRAGTENTEAEADIVEPAGIRSVLVHATPRAAGIVEHCTANAEQSGKDTSRCKRASQQSAERSCSALVTQRVTAQTIVAAKQQLFINARVADGIAFNGHEKQGVLALGYVVSCGAVQQMFSLIPFQYFPESDADNNRALRGNIS